MSIVMVGITETTASANSRPADTGSNGRLSFRSRFCVQARDGLIE